ncbi:type II secretion system minor pseudopilin GspK [Pseudophaeobacter arcticus]|uniref:type II secretion system minor pseudopilin GspK n=1 Tax=Pseudophaeobacter arcticus TaxID=385492 RepID=UPI0004201EF9|nr:type II secretion system minor pseudopilin GspK [Pseudophaeobacter arcticus]
MSQMNRTRPAPAKDQGARNQGTRDQGFVLVNALVLVAALAAVATLLLSRAEQGRSRLEAGLLADQLSLSLDGFDALALSQLARDSGSSDHLREAWAKPRPPLALARGDVVGQIQDLQGRFNVNWLSQADSPLAQEAFVLLLARLGLPPRIADDIRRFVTPGAELADRQRWLQRDPPLDPVGGPLLSADQLADLPGLSPRAYARLRPLITALPGDSRLNVNTARPEVLASFLPDLSSAVLARLLRQRDRQGFASVEDFLTAARLQQAEDTPQEPPASSPEGDSPPDRVGPEQISVSSQWFRVDSQARLDGRMASRVSLLHRRSAGRRPDLIWQVTSRP